MLADIIRKVRAEDLFGEAEIQGILGFTAEEGPVKSTVYVAGNSSVEYFRKELKSASGP